MVEEYRGSGLTTQAFAKVRGIPHTTMRRWIERAGRGPEGPPALLPVRVVTALAPITPGPARGGAPVEVALREGVVLRLAVGTDVAYVAALVERLR